MNLDVKLDHFYQSVIDEATHESESILVEYQASLKKIYDEKKAELEQKAAARIKVETDNLSREKNKQLSNEAVEIRKTISLRTEELINSLFDDIQNKVVEFMKTPEYVKLLEAQITAAYNFAKGEEIVIYINASDSAKLEELQQATGTTLTISNIDFMGGTRAVIHSRHVLIDNSFATKLAEEKHNFQF